MRPLQRIDVDSLRSLHVLLEERNVGRAAARLFISASAMSKTLHRLREAFGDPLLVRGSSGLVPTPQGEEIAVALQSAFMCFQQLKPAEFVPAKALAKLRFALPETFALGVIPKLVQGLRDSAPGVHIETLNLSNSYLERLADGGIDFAIYLEQEYPRDFISHPLFKIEPQICVRKDHPLTKLSAPTQEELYQYPVVLFRSLNLKMGQLHTLSKTMERAGIVRDVILETSQLFLALTAIQNSDAMMLAPDGLLQHLNMGEVLTVLPTKNIKLFDAVQIDLCLIQHERTRNSPLHTWLVSQTLLAAEQPRSLRSEH